MTHSGHQPGRAAWILLLIAINAIVLFNAVRHDPTVGYDAADHLKYIEVLSGFRLPARADTAEFFSPPLPYLFPALLRSTGHVSLEGAAKAGQLLNVLFSIGLTLALVALCDRVRPGDPWLKSLALIGLGMLPVYYKSFAMVRGEPLLAFLCVVAVERTLSFMLGREWNATPAIALGIVLGLVQLSRQWGFFLLPAVVVFAGLLALRGWQRWSRIAGRLALIFLVAGFASAWFYLHLRENVGSARAFNRPPAPSFSFANKPPEFYLGTGARAFYTDPIRPVFGDQLFPILHSEIWGDYWSAFKVYGRDTRDGSYLYGGALHVALSTQPPPDWLETNRYAVAPYLGRVNLVSLIPAWVLLAGLPFGLIVAWRWLMAGFRRRGAPADEGGATLTLSVLLISATIAGYGWFLLMYPRPDTIKATYVLQTFPLLAILAAEMMLRLRTNRPVLFLIVSGACLLVLLHNAPMLITNYQLAW